jgi:hypothetical protein
MAKACGFVRAYVSSLRERLKFRFGARLRVTGRPARAFHERRRKPAAARTMGTAQPSVTSA